MNRISISIIVTALILSGGPLYAQVQTGSLFARVVAEDGSALPGVVVTTELTTGGFSQEATTGPTGAVRFAAIPIGTYTVTFTLTGFTSVRHDAVRIGIGETRSMDVVFTPALAETVTVVADTVAVDMKRLTRDRNFDLEFLQDIPSARDPWDVMEKAPGLDISTVNVGGNESGNQSRILARGGDFTDTQWVLDGLNYGDLSSAGASPLYYDFDSFEELQISTAANDPSIPTGGVVINMVTKRPGNAFAGSASLYYDSEGTQGTNDSRLAEGVSGDRIDRIYDYGFELGGPLIKDRLWAWGAFRKNDISRFRIGDFKDHIVLTDINAKGIFQWNNRNETTLAYIAGDKDFAGRLFFGVDSQAPDTACDQTFPAWLLKLGHLTTPSDNFFVSLQYGHIFMPFDCFTKKGTVPQSVLRLNNDFFLEKNGLGAKQYNWGDMTNIDANYFKQNWAGGDHEFKFGFEYKHFNYTSFSNYGGDVALYDLVGARGDQSAGAGTAKLLLDFNPDVTIVRTSFYVQDVFRRGRLTLNLGLRFDHQTGTNNPVSIPANRTAPDILPGIQFDGNDPGQPWNSLAPRLGATYDLSGDGKTVLRGNYARFYEQLDGFVPFGINPIGNQFGVYVPYVDSNGDGVVNRDELRTEEGLQGFGGAQPFNSQAAVDRFLEVRSIQEGLSPPTSEEFLVGFEREIVSDVTFSATFVHRKYWDVLDQWVVGVTSADFTEEIPVSTESGFDIIVRDTPFVPADVKQVINIPDYRKVYRGIDIVLQKRMRDNWSLYGALNFQNQKQHFDSPDSFQDPSSVPFLDGIFYAPGSGRNVFRRGNTFLGSTWNFNLNGLYQFPHEVIVSAGFKLRSGFAVPFILRESTNFNQIGGTNLYNVQDFDGFRLETLPLVNVRLEKTFVLAESGRLSAIFDLFNVFNSDTALGVNRRADTATFGQINQILAPRIFRIGVKYQF